MTLHPPPLTTATPKPSKHVPSHHHSPQGAMPPRGRANITAMDTETEHEEEYGEFLEPLGEWWWTRQSSKTTTTSG